MDDIRKGILRIIEDASYRSIDQRGVEMHAVLMQVIADGYARMYMEIIYDPEIH